MNDFNVRSQGGIKFHVYYLTTRVKCGPGKGRKRPKTAFINSTQL